MDYEGPVRLDRRTKNLVKRLRAEDIALICHADLDRVSAESLVESRAKAVINADEFSTGRYPNVGPTILLAAGIHLVDNVGEELFEKVREGDLVRIEGGRVFRNGDLMAEGGVFTQPAAKRKLDQAEQGLGRELEKFALNTLDFIKDEHNLLLYGVELPKTATRFLDKQALVVARGYHYKEDLKMLASYIRDVRPVLIGVDGGADALVAEGLRPDVIIGDMDSVGDDTLSCGSELIVHAYPDGRAPGLQRVRELDLSPVILKAAGTSEDIAMLLAYEKGADLIVAVGTHSNLIEFLDKGRGGMASTFLTRLRVGGRLVDAKGVSRLYRPRLRSWHPLVVLLAAFIAMTTILFASPPLRQFMTLMYVKFRLMIGF
ncbi:MAG: putative cytokinetic ring protein SteA [Terriglobia bacterium]